LANGLVIGCTYEPRRRAGQRTIRLHAALSNDAGVYGAFSGRWRLAGVGKLLRLFARLGLGNMLAGPARNRDTVESCRDRGGDARDGARAPVRGLDRATRIRRDRECLGTSLGLCVVPGEP